MHAIYVICRINCTGMYFACAMVLVSWSCVMTVTVLNVHHRGGNGHKMPDWVRKVFLQWLAWILFVRSGNFGDTVPQSPTGITRKNSVGRKLRIVFLSSENKHKNTLLIYFKWFGRIKF